MFGGGVVAARRAEDVEPLETELLFDGPQRMHLTRNADHQQSLQAKPRHFVQQRQQWRVSHLHAAALG